MGRGGVGVGYPSYSGQPAYQTGAGQWNMARPKGESFGPSSELSGFDGGNYHSVGESDFGARKAADRQLARFFGEPDEDRLAKWKRMEQQKGPENWRQEYDDYPAAFRTLYGGNQPGVMSENGHIARVVIEKALASDDWQLNKMAPWQEHATSLDFMWEELRFNKHMLDREPEESVPRLLSHMRTQGQTSMVRYGIALLLEINFAKTAVGAQMYNANLEQMRIAMTETASYGAMVVAMEHERYEDPYSTALQSGAQRTKFELDRLLEEEARNFAQFHKDRNGYSIVLQRAREKLRSRNLGRDGNLTIHPRGSMSFLQQARDGKYYVDGPGGKPDAPSVSGSNVESRLFSSSDLDVGHDPLFKNVTIGGYVTLDDSTCHSVEAEAWRTWMLDGVIYDEERDEWFELHFSDIYDKTGVWDFGHPDCPMTDLIGLSFGYDAACYTWDQAIQKFCTDPQRVYRALEALKPAQRLDMMRSLRLMPATGDDRTDPDTPFGRPSFDALVNGGDAKLKKVYGPREHARFREQAERGDLRQYTDSNNREMREYNDEMAARNNHPDDAEDIGRLEDVFNDPVKSSKLPKNSAYYYNTTDSSGSSDSDEFEFELKDSVISKKLRNPAIEYRVLKQDPRKKKEKELNDPIKVATREFNTWYTEKLGGSKLVVADIKRWATEIIDQSHATASEKLTLVNELYRVLKSELATKSIRDHTEEFVRSVIVKYWIPALASVQTTIALRGVHVDRSRLENKVLKASGKELDLDDPSLTDADFNSNGWWNPVPFEDEEKAGSVVRRNKRWEDGQVKLFIGTNGATLPLPHDAYATTLAAEHTVWFDGVDARAPLTTPGPKRDRLDALHWSLAVSAFLTGNIDASSIIKAFDRERLKRIADTFTKDKDDEFIPRPVLLAQVHLRTLIQAAEKELRDAVISGGSGMFITGEEVRAHGTLTDSDAKAFQKTLRHGYQGKTVPKASKSFSLGADEMRDDSDSSSDDEDGVKLTTQVGPALAWSVPVIRQYLARASIGCGAFFRFCVQNHIPPPGFGLTFWRPHATYEMGSLIHMIAGSSGAMKTFYQCPNCKLCARHARH